MRLCRTTRILTLESCYVKVRVVLESQGAMDERLGAKKPSLHGVDEPLPGFPRSRLGRGTDFA
uniref:Uncharacterized protein n=1 Tax=Candidatus Kentrum eta TaxID=2126337 RepID=A0A450VAD4_9GAMM|nr:MAG: hypothetical protein BECKH772A_GA0070896_100748 [Candidatus Kentron sp. H]VFJ95179.1 MAG: hypothetical protein BECKH772B_GA0070898_100728 [Candidatus Kentron sp. H]VFK01743.1 MAG: hypothetical protein BECKH772C_GA0070978_100718 [Candidatus Kentron sp. H]